jgi:hypothetical protein
MINISQITGQFNASEIVPAVLAVIIVLGLIYAFNFGARLVLRLIEGETHRSTVEFDYAAQDRADRISRKLERSKDWAAGVPPRRRNNNPNIIHRNYDDN